MNQFYEVASPRTLASFICDLESMSKLTRAQTAMHAAAVECLTSNVGEEEATALCIEFSH